MNKIISVSISHVAKGFIIHFAIIIRLSVIFLLFIGFLTVAKILRFINSLPPWNFFMLFCGLLTLFKTNIFDFFKNTIRVSNSLDPDQA